MECGTCKYTGSLLSYLTSLALSLRCFSVFSELQHAPPAVIMVEIFLNGQTRSGPIWPFFFVVRRRNDRPDLVRPDLTIQKDTAKQSALQCTCVGITVDGRSRHKLVQRLRWFYRRECFMSYYHTRMHCARDEGGSASECGNSFTCIAVCTLALTASFL